MEGSSLLENLSVEVVRESPFISKSANEWMSEAKEKPIQRRLFGNLWFENELAILFAETNAGKSILAVQIADSISKGCSIPPFGMDANKQRVVYFDFELSEKQFEKRYSINGTEHYIFDEDLIRVENNPYADYPDGDYASFICDSIEECILHFNAKVAIIDNITYLNDELEKSRDALPLMKLLKNIKLKHNLSILILAHTPKRDLTRPLNKNDLQGSKMIMNFIDSAFVIGESAKDKSMRYIKHLKARNSSLTYCSENVLSCRIVMDHNFLKFIFMEECKESEHLVEKVRIEQEKLIETTKDLHSKGYGSRFIADVVGVSHSTINRLIRELKFKNEITPLESGTFRSNTDCSNVPDVPVCSTL